MKVLHVWDTAGVGSIIAKHMYRLYGTQSVVLMRKVFDKFGISSFYNATIYDCGAKVFVLKAFWKCFDVDIIHLHGLDNIIPYTKFLSSNPIVMHYHGSEIKGKWKQRRKYWRNADAILYSTPDLKDSETPEHAIYLPTIVDTDIFNCFNRIYEESTVLSMDNNLNHKKASAYAKAHNLELTIPHQMINYIDMPTFLKQFEYYLDMKVTGDPLSKTGLEALACGLKVINNKEEILEGLPEEHKPENVCSKLWHIYEDLKTEQLA